MKYLFPAIFLMAFSTQVSAQCTIANGDLENWSSGTDTCIFNTPITWESPDGFTPFVSALLSYFSCVAIGVTETMTAQSGSSAAALWTNNTTSTVADLVTIPSIPCNSKPGTFNGYYKINAGTSNDSLLIAIALFEAGDTAESGRGTMTMDLGTHGAYTAFSIPLTYDSGKNPDSAQIIIFLDADSAAHAGGASTEVLIDNLSFGGVSGVTTANTSKKINFYPNPVTDQLNVQLREPAQVTLTSVDGVQVINELFTSSAKIDMSEMATGVYILGIQTGDEVPVYERVVKQ